MKTYGSWEEFRTNKIQGPTLREAAMHLAWGVVLEENGHIYPVGKRARELVTDNLPENKFVRYTKPRRVPFYAKIARELGCSTALVHHHVSLKKIHARSHREYKKLGIMEKAAQKRQRIHRRETARIDKLPRYLQEIATIPSDDLEIN